MHVVQLFVSLLCAPNVEIVKTALPKGARIPIRFFSQVQFARDALLENLHHGGRRRNFRLAHQDVTVLGHHHVTIERELIARSHIVENFQE